MNTNLQNVAALAGRMLIAALFVMGGIEKIMHFYSTTDYMARAGMPAVELFAIGAILAELGGGLLLVIGWKTRWAAAALFLFLIPVTLMFHNPATGEEAVIHFMKNLSIMGGMLMLVAFGPGRFSLDKK